jgi:HEAT repeat protein
MAWKDAGDVLARGLADPSARVRQAALVALGGGHRTAAGAALVVRAARDPEAEVAQAAVAVLRSFGDQAVPALMELAADPKAKARAGALTVLAARAPRNDARAAAAGLGALKSPDAAVRLAGCRLLGAIGSGAHAGALAALKGDPDEGVRRAAEAAIADLSH